MPDMKDPKAKIDGLIESNKSFNQLVEKLGDFGEVVKDLRTQGQSLAKRLKELRTEQDHENRLSPMMRKFADASIGHLHTICAMKNLGKTLFAEEIEARSEFMGRTTVQHDNVVPSINSQIHFTQELIDLLPGMSKAQVEEHLKKHVESLQIDVFEWNTYESDTVDKEQNAIEELEKLGHRHLEFCEKRFQEEVRSMEQEGLRVTTTAGFVNLTQ